MTWRDGIVDLIEQKSELTDVYQFGIYLGESLIELKRMSGANERKFWGFDSFCGTPNTEKEGQWDPHSFSAQRDTMSTSVIEAEIKILDKLSGSFKVSTLEYDNNDEYNSKTVISRGTPQNLNDIDLSIFSGFYETSLRDEIAKDMKPAFYVDVDCDLYSSTVEALDFMFRNKLIVKGTILGFDDWGGTEGWQTASDGESKAFVEMLDKYQVKAHCLRQFGTSFPHVVRVYQIV